MKREMVKKVVTGGVVLLSTLLLSARVSTDAKTTDKQPIRVSQVAKTPVHHSQANVKAAPQQVSLTSPAATESVVSSTGSTVAPSTSSISVVSNTQASVSAPAMAVKSDIASTPAQTAPTAVSAVTTQPSQQSVAAVSTPASTNSVATQPVNPALIAFRNQLGVTGTDSNMQYMVTPSADGTVQIDVRSQAPDPEVSNLVGVYTYNPSTQAISAVDPVTGNQVVVQK